jgi:hypothetical protein
MEFSRFVSLCDATELGLCLYYKAKAFLITEEIPDEILRQSKCSRKNGMFFKSPN